jgi:uncharacterized protein YdaU (DUF1376 family)
MNYYQRHLGDYAKDTGWLTTYQHGVYALLLDWYYANEKPIPLELAYRIVKARSGPERKATDEVLLAFFDLNKAPGFGHNKHADIAIAKYRVKSEVNSLIAQERESTKRARSVAQSCDSGEPSHKPVTNSQERAKAGDACPHDEIIAMYHELLPANPRIKSWTGARQANLRTRWREDEKRQSLDYWRRFFSHVAASPFLTGQIEGQGGRAFLPGLDWLVKPDNFAKVIENRYHDRSRN